MLALQAVNHIRTYTTLGRYIQRHNDTDAPLPLPLPRLARATRYTTSGMINYIRRHTTYTTGDRRPDDDDVKMRSNAICFRRATRNTRRDDSFCSCISVVYVPIPCCWRKTSIDGEWFVLKSRRRRFNVNRGANQFRTTLEQHISFFANSIMTSITFE